MFLPLEDARGRSLEIFGRKRNMPRWEYLSSLTKVLLSTIAKACLTLSISLCRNVNGVLPLASSGTMLPWLEVETTVTRRWMFWREQPGGGQR